VPHLNEVQVLRFLVQFTLLFVGARVLADIMKRLGQATVIGELLAGIVLGPSVLGYVAPLAYRLIFPADPLSDHLLEALAWIGVIMLLLYTGLETDLEIIRGVGRSAAIISALGIIIPWSSGFLLGWEIPAAYLAAPNQRLIFSLFIAVAMSISAVPVIAKILLDLDLMHRDLGMMILAAGILDDTIGWLMLSMVAGLAVHGTVDLRTVSSIVVAVTLFIGFCYFIGASLVVRVMHWVDDRALAEHAGMSTMVGIAMVCAIVTQAIGIHAVFGAFIAGVMLSRSARMRKSDRAELEGATIGVFAPVFFAYSGLKVDLLTLHSVSLLAVILSIAIAGKLIGCTIGALLSGRRLRESLAVGTGMNARGGMEIIVALIGLSLGVLTQEMYAVIIMVAIITSLMTPPLLTFLLAGVEQRPEETERLEREKIIAQLPFSKAGAKLLVLAGGGANAQLAAHLAAVLGNHPDASITVFHATVGAQAEDSPAIDLPAEFERIKAIAGLTGATNVYSRSGGGDSIVEAIIKETERGYDAIFAGAGRADGSDTMSSEALHELLQRAQIPVIIARDAGLKLPFSRILAPTTGTPFSRLATTVGLFYAHAVRAEITAFYVRERPLLSLRNLPGWTSGRNEGRSIVEDMQTFADQLELTLDTEVATSPRPENAILAAAARGNFDLLLLGVMARPADGRLYFGPKVDHLLRNARCSVAIVVSPQITARE